MINSSFAPDIIILGSGPAGVSASFPLLKAGLKVMMLDYGNVSETSIKTGQSYEGIREDYNENPIFDDQLFNDVNKSSASSPKLRAATNRYIFNDYRDHYKVNTKNFILSGSLAAGGLSNGWGAGVSCYDDIDLEKFPIKNADLSDSYQEIAKRIGISGVSDDDLASFFGKIPLQSPTLLSDNIEKILKRYHKKPYLAKKDGVILGRNRIAVLTTDLSENRKKCHYCGLCVWGCGYKAIYSAKYDLDELKKYENFSYVDQAFIQKLRSYNDGYKITANIKNEIVEFYSKKIMLGLGTIGTTKLAFDALGFYNHDVKLLTNPVLGFAMFLPEELGRANNSNVLSTGQISLVINDASSPRNYALASIFPSDAILSSEYINHTPFSYTLSRKLIRLMQPAMVLGNCFMHSSYTENKINISASGEINISGSYKEEIVPAVKHLRKKIAKAMFRYRAFLLPGSLKLTNPGEDIHYAGTMPMKDVPTKPYELDSNGQIAGLPGVYVIDGAALSDLPAKPHTFTIMANANRIAKNLIK